MHIAITLLAADIQQAVAAAIEEQLGVEADVSVTTNTDGSYVITAGVGTANTKPVKTRKRRTPAEIAADAAGQVQTTEQAPSVPQVEESPLLVAPEPVVEEVAITASPESLVAAYTDDDDVISTNVAVAENSLFAL
jgi:hypothetical protein